MSRDEARNLKHGQVIRHQNQFNSDGTHIRARVTGALKTWKTRPDEFRLPIRHGLRDNGYLTQDNCFEWHLTEDAAEKACRRHEQ